MCVVLCCISSRSHASHVVATICMLGPVMGESQQHMSLHGTHTHTRSRTHTHTHTYAHTHTYTHIHTCLHIYVYTLTLAVSAHIHAHSTLSSHHVHLLRHCRMVLYYLVSEQMTPLKKLVYRHKLEAQKQITAVSRRDTLGDWVCSRCCGTQRVTPHQVKPVD